MATTTTNYGLTKPDTTDNYDIDVFNGNADIIDEKLKEVEELAKGSEDIDDMTPTFTEAETAANIASGETISTIMGKIMKIISSFLSHITTKATGSVLGHVTLSDTYDSKVTGGAAANGLGASQNALYFAYHELSKDLGGVKFGIESGSYGYYNASDTFVAFKSQADIDAAVSAAMVGNSTAADVLAGKIFTNSTDSGLTGTMANNGAISKTITPKTTEQSYTIPTGYHNGSGKVTVPAVAITAPAASKILTGSSVSVTSDGTTLKSVTGSMADYSSNVQTVTCNSKTGTQKYSTLADGYHTSIKVDQTAPYNAGKANPSIVSYTESIPANIGIPAAKTLYKTITASTMGMSKIYGCTVTPGTTNVDSRPYPVYVSLASGLESANIYVQSGDGYARTSLTAASLVFRGLSA